MSELEDLMGTVERNDVDYTDEAQIPPTVATLLEALVTEVGVLRTEIQTARTAGSATGMARADALKAAREHVEAMATNARGYQDGVSLANKVSAVDTFARFLLGEERE